MIPGGGFMARKAIPDATQATILLKSRRRCCLCFWLKGEEDPDPAKHAQYERWRALRAQQEQASRPAGQ